MTFLKSLGRQVPLCALALLSAPAFADGLPVDREIGFQPTVTHIGQIGHSMHNDLLMPIITAIVLFVFALLVYVMWRYRASANPVPSKNTHNTLIEIVWTGVPVLILIIIAIPSFKLLYAESQLPAAPAVTIKATGHQWYWQYEYPDQKIGFDANLVQDKDLKPGQPRLLETDNHIVVPVGKVVKLLTTSADVIHAWTIPAFFMQMDAVPGRLNETWFKADKVGTYYGQCNQICGINHGYMPITVEVVSAERYAEWLARAKTKFALNDNGVPGAGRLADASGALSMPAR